MKHLTLILLALVFLLTGTQCTSQSPTPTETPEQQTPPGTSDETQTPPAPSPTPSPPTDQTLPDETPEGQPSEPSEPEPSEPVTPSPVGENVTISITPNGSRLELPQDVEPIPFPTGTVDIATWTASYHLEVEVAETFSSRARGLMYRTAMPEEAGMLFWYPSDSQGGYWMFNTFIDLSIAYIDANGTILAIRDMKACGGKSRAECSVEARPYDPGIIYRYALEVNQGYFAARDIRVGNTISFHRHSQ